MKNAHPHLEKAQDVNDLRCALSKKRKMPLPLKKVFGEFFAKQTRKNGTKPLFPVEKTHNGKSA